MYVVTIGVAGLQYALTHQQTKETAVDLFKSSSDHTLLIVFGIVASSLAPFVEELIFRGFLFNAMLRYAPVFVAALISGCVFGAVHGSLTAFAPLAAAGVVLAYPIT